MAFVPMMSWKNFACVTVAYKSKTLFLRNRYSNKYRRNWQHPFFSWFCWMACKYMLQIWIMHCKIFSHRLRLQDLTKIILILSRIYTNGIEMNSTDFQQHQLRKTIVMLHSTIQFILRSNTINKVINRTRLD